MASEVSLKTILSDLKKALEKPTKYFHLPGVGAEYQQLERELKYLDNRNGGRSALYAQGQQPQTPIPEVPRPSTSKKKATKEDKASGVDSQLQQICWQLCIQYQPKKTKIDDYTNSVITDILSKVKQMWNMLPGIVDDITQTRIVLGLGKDQTKVPSTVYGLVDCCEKFAVHLKSGAEQSQYNQKQNLICMTNQLGDICDALTIENEKSNEANFNKLIEECKKVTEKIYLRIQRDEKERKGNGNISANWALVQPGSTPQQSHLEDTKKEIENLKKQLAEKQIELSEARKMSQDEITKLQQQVNQLQNENNQLKNRREQAEEHSKKRNTKDPKITELEEQLRKSNAEYAKIEALHEKGLEEINYWRNRVSKMAGAKLTHENPGITDLSDPNRPTKLGEQFSEIYDNLWTDTLENLTEKSKKKPKLEEKEAIQLIASILKECYDYCEKRFLKTLQEMENSLIPNASKTKVSLDVEEEKQLKDLLKSTGVKTAKGLNEDEVLMGKKEFQPYMDITKSLTKHCLEVCWLMVIQDPPVVLVWGDLKRGSTIDMDKFAWFTRSGDKLEYVVWPALLLHHNGPVLKKGVVQPISNKNTNTKL